MIYKKVQLVLLSARPGTN